MLERQKYELLRSELKKDRLAASLRQIDLAKILKKPQSYISKIESGERNLDLIEFIAYTTALGIDPSKWIKKFIDKITTNEARGAREIIMPMADAKSLRDEITKLLLDQKEQSPNPTEKIEVVFSGGKW